jgi:hypothetical protein
MGVVEELEEVVEVVEVVEEVFEEVFEEVVEEALEEGVFARAVSGCPHKIEKKAINARSLSFISLP